MNSMDQQVLTQLVQWLEQGRRAWLCTIIQTFGSSPRPVGSLLACHEDGQYVGSLSGGCVEDDLRESIFQGRLAKQKPERITYGVAVEDVMRLGLPCGGTLEVVVEPIAPEQASLYRTLANAIHHRQPMTRRLDISSGKVSLEPARHFSPLQLSGDQMSHTYGPNFQLLLIGAVQVAYYLADMAQALDYQVAICDPRQELIDQCPLQNVELHCGMPDDWLRNRSIDQQTAVIALCHDPRIDDMALMEVLHRDAFYIGAMGSAKTSEKRRQRLLSLDVTTEELAKLHAPVGLDIGSKTPPEIAIAILAELTQLRASRHECS
jgi:xanthine dehydrogenase accessory factor